MESDVAGHAQDDLTDHDERAVLAELAVGLIDHEADERVSDTVPDTHHHGQGRSDHHANADPAHQVVGGVVHHHQINVGCGVVQRVACDTPQGNAVDAVVLIVLIIELIRQTSGFAISFSPLFTQEHSPFSPWGLQLPLRTSPSGTLCLYYERFLIYLLVIF